MKKRNTQVLCVARTVPVMPVGAFDNHFSKAKLDVNTLGLKVDSVSKPNVHAGCSTRIPRYFVYRAALYRTR